MSRFHTFIKNESSSESEEDGELIGDNEDLQDSQDVEESKRQELDTKTLKASKSLQIVDKIDTKRNNRFSIWSDFLMEEELNHSVTNSMDIKKKKRPKNQLDRESENYSFWTKNQFEDKSEDKELTQNTDNSVALLKNKKRKKDKNKVIDRRVDFALEMAKKLNEPKVDLMRKVCHAIGEQKTAELCSAALDIETAGGLMTVDGKRRRTPGGVFFQLLKNDANINKDSIEFIFSDEQKRFQLKKKQKKKDKNKAKKSNHVKLRQNKTDSNDTIMTIEKQLNQSLSMN